MIAILACVITFDLFSHPDRSITFDGRVHITTIAMYHDLLATGEVPIAWVDNWGNYGHPLGLISYQTTSYLGGLIEFLVGSPVLAYNWLFWLATFSAGVLVFIWLRQHVGEVAAILGTVFFMFAPYRLQNIYVRGALPEYFAVTFLLLTLLGIQQVIKGRRSAHLLVILGVALTVLTNPMMLVTGIFVLVPYALFLWKQGRKSTKELLGLGLSVALGLGMATYYFVPLLLEIKYFHYGIGSKLRSGEFLSLTQLLSPFAPYFGSSHPGPPGVSLRLGVLEVMALGSGLLALLTGKLRGRALLVGAILLTLLLTLLTLPVSQILFEKISFLNGLQYPWRFLSVVGIVIPFLVALLFEAYGNMALFLVALVAILTSRVPLTYGKNYISTPDSQYRFTVTNLHTKNLAPLWAGEAADYVVHPEKVAILEGKGVIQNLKLENSRRRFSIAADGNVRLIDYTFYFPGWRAYVDGSEVPIEFQDVNHRGVITYTIPPGTHQVEVRFTPTRIRKLAAIATLLSVGTALVWFVVLRRKRYY